MTTADLIIKPIITEKSLDDARGGRYTFEVQLKANKNQIRQALDKAFDVKVRTIKTAVTKEKRRTIAKTRHQVSGRVWKKATVQLSSGKLTMFEVGGENGNKEA